MDINKIKYECNIFSCAVLHSPASLNELKWDEFLLFDKQNN